MTKEDSLRVTIVIAVALVFMVAAAIAIMIDMHIAKQILENVQ